MTTIYYERDGDLAALEGSSIAVVGYGNQGRSWALNLRDSGLAVRVCVRADESRQQARADGFEVEEIAKAIGGLREGAIELTPLQEVILDLSVEQILSPALTHVSAAFVSVMLEQGIPFEAILTELFLSGEVERTYGLLRTEGFAEQLEHHSPVSQYGQLSRRGSYDSLEFAPLMRRIAEDIRSGRFADEWDAEAGADHARLRALKEQHAGPAVRAMERDLRRRLGPGVRE